MLFPSAIFLFVFLPLLIILYYNPFFNGIKYKNSVLLLASLFFYAWGESAFVFIMIASIAINFFLVRIMNKSENRKFFLILIIVWNVLLLFIFKYLGFFISNILRIIPSAPIPYINLALPIGISFFTFQILSYGFDVYYKKVPPQENIIDFALYIMLFPQLIAGPIVRYETIASQIRLRKEGFTLFSSGFIRFVIGLSKKCILADSISIVADGAFNLSPEMQSGAILWIGAIAYTFQIYFDFSGYSDMAIGLGKMFGFKFNENFNYPYIATSITDFWRRWHISLSSWFKDYVYIPLGGSRIGKLRQVINLLIVWSLTGMWHGAAWNFVIWGLYYFVLLSIEKIFLHKLNKSTVLKIIWRICTPIFIVIGWVIFRSESSILGLSYITKMFNPQNFIGGFLQQVQIQNIILIFILCIIASIPIIPYIKRHCNFKRSLSLLSAISVISLLFICVCIIFSNSYSPFIYFNF